MNFMTMSNKQRDAWCHHKTSINNFMFTCVLYIFFTWSLCPIHLLATWEQPRTICYSCYHTTEHTTWKWISCLAQCWQSWQNKSKWLSVNTKYVLQEREDCFSSQSLWKIKHNFWCFPDSVSCFLGINGFSRLIINVWSRHMLGLLDQWNSD